MNDISLVTGPSAAPERRRLRQVVKARSAMEN
jgi:hypothetical protein